MLSNSLSCMVVTTPKAQLEAEKWTCAPGLIHGNGGDAVGWCRREFHTCSRKTCSPCCTGESQFSTSCVRERVHVCVRVPLIFTQYTSLWARMVPKCGVASPQPGNSATPAGCPTNLTQFQYCLPGESVICHRLRA